MLLYYLTKRRNTKIAFSLKCCISALPEFNHLFDFFQSFWLTTHTDDAVWLPKSCNQCVQPAGLLGAWFMRKEVESAAGVGLLRAQCTSALSSGFPISQGNAVALERWGGKTKRRLISYFLSNISAKNYRNRNVCVTTIASQMRDVFDTRCTFRVSKTTRNV